MTAERCYNGTSHDTVSARNAKLKIYSDSDESKIEMR